MSAAESFGLLYHFYAFDMSDNREREREKGEKTKERLD